MTRWSAPRTDITGSLIGIAFERLQFAPGYLIAFARHPFQTGAIHDPDVPPAVSDQPQLLRDLPQFQPFRGFLVQVLRYRVPKRNCFQSSFLARRAAPSNREIKNAASASASVHTTGRQTATIHPGAGFN